MATVAELEKQLDDYRAVVDQMFATLSNRVGALENPPIVTQSPGVGAAVTTEYKGRVRPALVVGMNKNATVFDLQVVMSEQGGRDVAALELVANVPLSALDFGRE